MSVYDLTGCKAMVTGGARGLGEGMAPAGAAIGIKHGLRAMRPGGQAGSGGAIVNVASAAATIAFPGIGAGLPVDGGTGM